MSNHDADLLALASDGMTDKQIATLTGVSSFTVNDRWKSIFRKLNVHNRGAAIRLWMQYG